MQYFIIPPPETSVMCWRKLKLERLVEIARKYKQGNSEKFLSQKRGVPNLTQPNRNCGTLYIVATAKACVTWISITSVNRTVQRCKARAAMIICDVLLPAMTATTMSIVFAADDINTRTDDDHTYL